MGWRGRARFLALMAAVSMSLAAGAVSGAYASTRPAPRHEAAAAYQQTGALSAAIADPGDAGVGVPVTLDGSGSRGDSLVYRWDFGDGSPPALGARVQHTFSLVDDYRVQLTVQDRQGNQDTLIRSVRVQPVLESLVGQPELRQIVPASSFTAFLTLNAAGPSRLSVTIGGRFLSSARWDYQGGSGRALLEIPDVRVVDEDDPDIVDQLLSRPGASIPLMNNVGITVSYPVSGGGNESATYTVSLLNQPASMPAVGSSASYLQAAATPAATPQATPTPGAPAVAPATGATPISTPAQAAPQPSYWSISYPSYLLVVGRPANEDDVDDYYLKGDSDFHAVDTLTLRRWAIKIARNGGIFPNDPQRAADNIYRYVNGLLGISDPGELQTDLTILGRVEDGILVPGARRGEYICIAHAYFVSSLTRTLGLPTRELTVAFGRGVSQDNSGAWNMNYYQEGANEVWYGGAWHHYDTWIGTRNRTDYLDTNLTEISWYAFSAEQTPFLDINGHPVGLKGHDFSLGKYVGSPGAPEQWRFLEQQSRPGIRIADPGPAAYTSTERAAPAPRPAETVVAGIRNPSSGD